MTTPIRLLALGDSFTEGVGDPDESRPNGVRGWADRTAEVLCNHDPSARYANLAIRGRMLNRVMAEQIPAALELKPSIVTLYAGANDILRPKVNLELILGNYRDHIEALRRAGIQVYLFTGFDPSTTATYAWMRPRVALYNELVRDIAADLDCGIVDYWRLKHLQDWRFWGIDRMHMNANGHSVIAREVLRVIFGGIVTEAEISSHIPVADPEPMAEIDRRAQIIANLQWTREHALPWIKRRLTGTSSGDGLSAKYPDWETFQARLAR